MIGAGFVDDRSGREGAVSDGADAATDATTGTGPAAGARPARARLLPTCVAVGVLVALWGSLALPARATYGARTTADEPQYLLSALSLAEDRDLWIDDEIADERYRDFHEVTLPVQTEPRGDGREISPHDPLLPAVLALPVGVAGWAGAKALLAALAGAMAGVLVWVARRRFGVRLGLAAGTVLAFGLAAPLSAYATQVYPELPAALAVTVAVALLTGRPGRWPAVGLALAVMVLPWLGVKYVPVAAVLALAGLAWLWRAGHGRLAVATAAGLGLGALGYLVAHRLLYGGWTVYAAGDHFVDGELVVMGHDPNYVGRTRRLAGLLLDRTFGLAAWMPGYLLAVPALAVLVRRRPPGWVALVAPLGAAWATATWVALTMHGWWWPGRQVVVAVPCCVLAVAWWAEQVRAGRWGHLVPGVLAAVGAAGAVLWLWLVIEVRRSRLTLVVDFFDTRNPLYRAWRRALPDYWHPGTDDWVLQAGWLAALAAAAVLAWRLTPGATDLRTDLTPRADKERAS